jgi:hypothetical protein
MSCALRPPIGSPSKTTDSRATGRAPATERRNVVFPAPLAPMTHDIGMPI